MGKNLNQKTTNTMNPFKAIVLIARISEKTTEQIENKVKEYDVKMWIDLIGNRHDVEPMQDLENTKNFTLRKLAELELRIEELEKRKFPIWDSKSYLANTETCKCELSTVNNINGKNICTHCNKSKK